MATRKQIFEVLSSVYDTCSIFNGTRLDIVEMGLVHEVEQDEGIVRVQLLLTDPMCEARERLERRRRARLAQLGLTPAGSVDS
jgi:metal-sulfur cluster biosynthetic enzyme